MELYLTLPCCCCCCHHHIHDMKLHSAFKCHGLNWFLLNESAKDKLFPMSKHIHKSIQCRVFELCNTAREMRHIHHYRYLLAADALSESNNINSTNFPKT